VWQEMAASVMWGGWYIAAVGSGIRLAGFLWPLNHTRDTPNDAPDDAGLGADSKNGLSKRFVLLLNA